MGVPINALTPTAAPPQPTRKISTARASFFRDQLRAGFFLAEVLGFSGTTIGLFRIGPHCLAQHTGLFVQDQGFVGLDGKDRGIPLLGLQNTGQKIPRYSGCGARSRDRAPFQWWLPYSPAGRAVPGDRPGVPGLAFPGGRQVPPGEHVIGHRTDAIDIGPAALPAVGLILFRRREAGIQLAFDAASPGAQGQGGKSGDPDAGLLIHQDIAGTDAAVDQPAPMDRRQRGITAPA